MTNRRRPRGHVGKSPAGRSAQSRAPAARGDRPAASSKRGRAAAARKAPARRRQSAAVVAIAVSILIAVGVLAFRGGRPTAGAVTNPAPFSLPPPNATRLVRPPDSPAQPLPL